MPLKNLNWKRRSSGALALSEFTPSSTSGGQYLLGTVDLAFHPYDAQQLNWGGFLPLGSPMVNYYRKPYLYIYFAICEVRLGVHGVGSLCLRTTTCTATCCVPS